MTSTVLIVPLLLSGCGDEPGSLQKAPLSGPNAGLGRFEGRWFDCEGRLLAVVDGQRAPELSVWLSQYMAPIRLEDARLRGDQILFSVQNNYFKQPIIGYLKLIGENRLQMGQAAPQDHVCGNSRFIPYTVLIRNPSPGWLMRQSERRRIRAVKEICAAGRDYVFDRLARIL